MTGLRMPWWGIGGLIALLALTAPSLGAAPARGGTLIVGLDQEPPTIDPHA